jgi:hypothetical protein
MLELLLGARNGTPLALPHSQYLLTGDWLLDANE